LPARRPWRGSGTDKKGTILIIGAEKHLPMTPALTKKLWFGKKKVEEIFLHDQKFYDQNKVTVESASRSPTLDPKQRSVTTNTGKQYRYQKLLLATGGVPRRYRSRRQPRGNLLLPYIGRLPEVAERIHGGKKAVVIGGGFIGSEIAAAMAMNKST